MADLPDPSTLTDEELDNILGEGAPVANPPEPETPPAPSPEPEADPEPPVVEDPAPDPEDPPVEEPDKPISRREQLRINQLLEKMKQKPAAEPPQPPASPDALNYREALDADPEIIKQLEDDRQRAATAAYQDGLKQIQASEWRTMLNIDSPAVDAKYPQLNKNDKDNFHPAVANSVNSFYLQMVGYDEQTGMPANPGIRYGEFADAIFELAEEIAATRVEKTRTNVVKQAALTGIRPDGSASKRLDLSKAPEDMSDEELDAYLAKSLKR